MNRIVLIGNGFDSAQVIIISYPEFTSISYLLYSKNIRDKRNITTYNKTQNGRKRDIKEH